MKRLTGALVVVGLLLAGTTALADKLSIKDAKQAFAALKKQGKAPRLAPGTKTHTYTVKNKKGESEKIKVWVGAPALITPVPMSPDPVSPKCELAFKVWAELSDENGTHSGKLVNIQRYKWQKNEYFYFWFESAVPVQMSLSQYYDVGPSEARKPRLVSPDAAFPKTYATVQGGEKTYFPQLFKTDDNLADEFAMLTLVAAGASVTPYESKGAAPTPPPINKEVVKGTDTPGGIGAVFKETNEFFVTLTPKKVAFKKSAKASLSPRLLQAVDDKGAPSQAESGDLNRTTCETPDEAALFVLGSQKIGHLPLRFWKK